jgi:hypothetical protein
LHFAYAITIIYIGEEDFNVYPNPSSGMVYLDNVDIELVKNLVVVNGLGQVAARFSPNMQLDMSHLSNGAYWLRIEMNDGAVLSKKIVLRK